MNEFIYKKCYFSCESCIINGNDTKHNCLECNNNYPKELKVDNFLNCYQNCRYYYYFDESNKLNEILLIIFVL